MSVNSEQNPPIFNVPRVIILFIAVIVMVHLYRTYLLTNSSGLEFILEYAFIPARYTHVSILEFSPWAGYWTPISYSFLHSDWLHLIINSFWMLAFGSVVARRLGGAAFLVFCALGSVGGAFAHYIFHVGELVPMIGASGVVSACMGGACRFAFPEQGRFSPENAFLPIQTIPQTFANRQAMTFIVFWFLINYLAGSGIIGLEEESSQIAWQAHVGGFIAGFFLIPFVRDKST